MAVGAAMLVAVPVALAQKVLNPTNDLGATVTALSFAFAKGTSHEQHGSVSGLSAPVFSGATIGPDGSFTVPAANVTYPPYSVPDQSGTTAGVNWSVTKLTVQLVPTSDVTGSLNPFTGTVVSDWHAYLKVNYDLTASYLGTSDSYQPSNCTIGTPSSPIDIPLTSGTTSPSAGTPNVPISGIPYSESTGSLGLVNNTVALPGSSGDCNPTLAFFTFSFDDLVGLPSPSGYNTLTASMTLHPIIHRGVIAALQASQRTGPAPLTVSFDASGTQAPAGVAAYRFDFDGNGTADQVGTSPTGRFTFTTPGTYVARVTVIDKDGDSDTATISITVTPPIPTVTTTGKPRVSSQGTGFTVDDGQTVHCPAAETVCLARVTATTSGKATQAAVATIGRATLQIAAGRSAPARFKLSPAGARLLRRLHRLPVTVTLVVRDGSGKLATTVKRLVLSQPRRKPG